MILLLLIEDSERVLKTNCSRKRQGKITTVEMKTIDFCEVLGQLLSNEREKIGRLTVLANRPKSCFLLGSRRNMPMAAV